MIPIFSSHHSLLRSILTLEEPSEIVDNSPTSIFSICQKHQIKDLFLCENSSYSGFIEAYKTAEKEKINLHFGQKLVCCEDIEKKDEESLKTEHKIVIWALSTEGSKLLQKIYSKASIDGFYYQARIDFKTLKQYWNNEHLLLTIPFYDSFIFKNLMFFNTAIIPDFGEIKPIFHVENHNLPFDNLVKDAAESYCKINNYETLETHSVYYYNKSDFTAYNVFRCIENRTTLSKPNLEYFSSTEFSFESFLEKQNLNNNIEFLNKFKKYHFIFHGVRLPEINITKEQKEKIDTSINCNNYEYLTYLCYKGFEKRLKENKIKLEETEIYTQKCKEELEIFKKNGLVDYFLLIYDILNWCDENNIARGIARGSSSGSVVLFLIGITHISPVTNNLYFTRFINEARLQSKVVDGVTFIKGSSIADVDSDVSYERRQEVINYISKKYKGNVCKIGTQITLSSKIAIKEILKSFLEYSEDETKNVVSLIESHFGTLESLISVYKHNPEFKKWCEKNNKNTKVYLLAQKIENLIKSKGCHPSGIAISYYDLDEIMPRELSPSKEIVTSYEMKTVSDFLVKIDILGLKNADINYNTAKLVGIDVNSININDPSIYKYLQSNDLYFGLFQIEKGLSKEVIKKVGPRNIDEIACCISISRPGAYQYIDQYVKYVKNNELILIHPLFDKILSSTGNIIIFQEQINQICQEIYKMSAIDADQVRFCIGKKLTNEIKKWEPILFEKGKENNIPEEITKYFWETCNNSAKYLFMKGHGFSYAYMTAINTYFKANYPKEFFLSLLKMAKNEPNTNEVFSQISQEMKKLNIQLYPPHILYSDIDFKVHEKGIIFGIGGIKGISDKAIEKLQNFKTNYSNKFDIFSAANEARIPINIMFSLIMAGSMDDMLTETRSKTVLELVLWNLLTAKEKKYCSILGSSAEFNFNLINIIKHLNKEKKDEKGKPVIKNSRLETIRKHFRPYHEMYKNNLKYESIYQYIMEKELIGFNYNSDLYSIFKKEIPELLSINDVKSLMDGEYVRVSGEIISSVERRKSKEKKTPYIKFTINDGTDSIDCLAFNSNNNPIIDQIEENNARLPAESDLCIIYATKQNDVLFVKRLGVQDIKIIRKISEIELEPEIKTKN